MFLRVYHDLFLLYCIYVNYKKIVNFYFNLYVFFTRYMFVPVESKSKPFSLKLENLKKEHNLKTYRQIVDFIEGKPVSEVKPNIKDKLLKIGLMLASALISYSLIYLGLSVFGR